MKTAFKNLQFALFSLVLLSLSSTSILAQNLAIAISPPISEIVIMPGKEVLLSFTIINHGADGYATFSLAQFLPKDEYGNISADDSTDITGSPTFSSWFTLPEKNYIRSGETKNVSLKISPPENTPEKDYYFTFFYEVGKENLINFQTGSGNTAKAKVGANILISVSQTGQMTKKAGPVSLTAPKIIDSLQGLTYKLRVGNAGQFFFKPMGIIEINSFLGKKEILALAPVNVVSGSSRFIPCLENEALTECKIKQRVLIGIYQAKASFTTDENGELYSSQTTTLAFPFSITIAVTTVILGYLTIRKIVKKTSP